MVHFGRCRRTRPDIGRHATLWVRRVAVRGTHVAHGSHHGTALQVANIVGLLFGAVMTFQPDNYWLQILVVFPAVATSRQLVYSTLFHTIGRVFGYANYGVLLGLTNAIASLFQSLQTPMVKWSENNMDTTTTTTTTIDINDTQSSSSYGNHGRSNLLLWLATIPLFVTVMYSDPVRPKSKWLSSSSSWWWCCTRRNTCDDDDDDCNDGDYDFNGNDHDYDDCDNEAIVYEGTSLLYE